MIIRPNPNIVQDFVKVCKGGSLTAVQHFYDANILARYDPTAYNQLMGTVYIEVRKLDSADPVTTWFQQLAIKNHPIKYNHGIYYPYGRSYST